MFGVALPRQVVTDWHVRRHYDVRMTTRNRVQSPGNGKQAPVNVLRSADLRFERQVAVLDTWWVELLLSAEPSLPFLCFSIAPYLARLSRLSTIHHRPPLHCLPLQLSSSPAAHDGWRPWSPRSPFGSSPPSPSSSCQAQKWIPARMRQRHFSNVLRRSFVGRLL